MVKEKDVRDLIYARLNTLFDEFDLLDGKEKKLKIIGGSEKN